VDVSLQYASESELPLSDDAETIGRRTTLPVHLRFLPSLQVVSVAFHEHHVPTTIREDLGGGGRGGPGGIMPIRRSSSLGDLQLPGPSLKLSGGQSARGGRSRKTAAATTTAEDDTWVDEPGGPAAAATPYVDAGVMRCCVLEVDAINCSDVVLQVKPNRHLYAAHPC
jgi:hypothetical protein